MPLLTVQYLEDSDFLPALTEQDVIAKLHDAARIVPLTHLLIGWHVPPHLLEACRREAEHLGLRLIRWQPLLTPTRDFHHQPGWRVENLYGTKLMGYNAIPEFSFSCPNHPAVQQAVVSHLEELAASGIYQGFFLDRIRYPSPSANPVNELGCFCEHCHRKAAGMGLDLEQVRSEILLLSQEERGRIALAQNLLSRRLAGEKSQTNELISQFMEFRCRSIYDFLELCLHPLKEAHLEVGLDCFAPCLTNSVGQDLHALSSKVDWVKVMTYAHTLAPAGVPFELSGCVRYLASHSRLDEFQALQLIGKQVNLPLPESLEELENHGLSPQGLKMDVERGLETCSAPLLAGVELVSLPGITFLNPAQITADLVSINHANPAGLALSWDLWHIPLGYLDLVHQAYFVN